MAISITDFFGFESDKQKGRPLLNQMPMHVRKRPSVGISTVLAQKQKFWKWFRGRPELNSPVMIRVDDTITEIDFYKPDGTPLGRNKRINAEKFWNDNQLYERLKSVQFDRLVTGSGFIWLGFLNDDDVKQVKDTVFNKFWFKSVDMAKVKASIDEDLRLPRMVDYVASSTVVIEHSRHEVKRYIQFFLSYNEEFSPKEIIHIPLHRLDGKVDGFTPVESLSYELVLIWAIKENMLSYFRNGGSPSKAWILPDELSNSENHAWLTQELMNKGRMENRHGNFVLTGKVEIQDLEPNIKDMDYKELSLYVASNIAYALRVPVSRIPYLIGKSATGSDAGGLAESGYWAMIESDQKTIEMHLNTQLFNKLGFMIKFKKKYKIDDIREAQALNFKVDAVTKIQTELKNAGLKLQDDKLRALFDLNSNDVTELTEEEKMSDMERSGLLNRSFAQDREVTPGRGQQNQDSTKREAAKNNPKGSNQTGV